jgi:hypothetical protein
MLAGYTAERSDRSASPPAATLAPSKGGRLIRLCRGQRQTARRFCGLLRFVPAYSEPALIAFSSLAGIGGRPRRLSSLPTYLEIVNRRITTLSERKTDPLHDKIVNLAPLLESPVALRRQLRANIGSNDGYAAVAPLRASWALWKGLAGLCLVWPFLSLLWAR